MSWIRDRKYRSMVQGRSFHGRYFRRLARSAARTGRRWPLRWTE